MKLGIDSYCYHRYFGEIYPTIEKDPGSRITLREFLNRAKVLGVEAVSLESCFFPQLNDSSIDGIRDAVEEFGFDVVWAWGHPSGLRSGDEPEAVRDLAAHAKIAARIGAKVMRICCGGRRTRPASWATHKSKLLPLLREAVEYAEEQQVVLAIENHIDLLADELVELVTTIDSPYLGVCLDTANNLRMLEEPIEVIRKLAPFARASHVKDIMAQRGNPREFAFWPSVPLGKGLIDIPKAFELLRAANYDGVLALEIDYLHPAYGEDAGTAIAESIAYMRQLLSESAVH